MHLEAQRKLSYLITTRCIITNVPPFITYSIRPSKIYYEVSVRGLIQAEQIRSERSDRNRFVSNELDRVKLVSQSDLKPG